MSDFSLKVGLQWTFKRVFFPGVQRALQSILWFVWIFSQWYLYSTNKSHVCICRQSPWVVRIIFIFLFSDMFSAVPTCRKVLISAQTYNTESDLFNQQQNNCISLDFPGFVFSCSFKWCYFSQAQQNYDLEHGPQDCLTTQLCVSCTLAVIS